LSQRRFFDVLERCIDRLPKNAARVFTMREILGMETPEICAAVGITANNCFVMLHRARTTLRTLLEQDWFDPRPAH
jgi:RNA polymerase sigma-70 factor (ECF subfamily)